jgi:hypothetical protein
MPVRAVEEPALPDIVRWLAASRRRRNRRLALVAVGAIAFISALALGRFFVQRSETPLAVPARPTREVASPVVTAPVSEPAFPRATDGAASPRPPFSEIVASRDREHPVTASVDYGKVRISSSRPGYVYVLAAPADRSVVVLFPEASDTSNRIEPGQALTLPALRWPTNAKLLALVSDEPRHIDGLGPPAGIVICHSSTRCSPSYGAVVFSRDSTHETARRLPAVAVPAARPTSAAPRRCSDILERASLGEALTDDEKTFLRRDCR